MLHEGDDALAGDDEDKIESHSAFMHDGQTPPSEGNILVAETSFEILVAETSFEAGDTVGASEEEVRA